MTVLQIITNGRKITTIYYNALSAKTARKGDGKRSGSAVVSAASDVRTTLFSSFAKTHKTRRRSGAHAGRGAIINRQ